MKNNFEAIGPLTPDETEKVRELVDKTDPKLLLDIIIEDGRKRMGAPDSLSKVEIARMMDEESAAMTTEEQPTESTELEMSAEEEAQINYRWKETQPKPLTFADHPDIQAGLVDEADKTKPTQEESSQDTPIKPKEKPDKPNKITHKDKNEKELREQAKKMGYPEDISRKELIERRAAELGVDFSTLSKDDSGSKWFAIKKAIAEKIGIEDITLFTLDDLQVPIEWIENLSKDVDLDSLSASQKDWIESTREKMDIKIGSESASQIKPEEQEETLNRFITKIESVLEGGKNLKTTIGIEKELAKEAEQRLKKAGYIWKSKKEVDVAGNKVINFVGIMRVK